MLTDWSILFVRYWKLDAAMRELIAKLVDGIQADASATKLSEFTEPRVNCRESNTRARRFAEQGNFLSESGDFRFSFKVMLEEVRCVPDLSSL